MDTLSNLAVDQCTLTLLLLFKEGIRHYYCRLRNTGASSERNILAIMCVASAAQMALAALAFWFYNDSFLVLTSLAFIAVSHSALLVLFRIDANRAACYDLEGLQQTGSEGTYYCNCCIVCGIVHTFTDTVGLCVSYCLVDVEPMTTQVPRALKNAKQLGKFNAVLQWMLLYLPWIIAVISQHVDIDYQVTVVVVIVWALHCRMSTIIRGMYHRYSTLTHTYYVVHAC